MKRILRVVGNITLILFLISGCTKIIPENLKYNFKNESELSRQYKDQNTVKMPQIPGYQLIVSNPARGVYVYGKKLDAQPYFQQVLVKTNTAQKQFNWTATTRTPVLLLSDITGSGQDNIIIIFITSYGTGLIVPEIHVLDMALTREIPVESPALAAKRLIAASIQGPEIVFRAGGKEYRARPRVGPGGIQDAFKNLQYGSVVNYRVENKKLKATVSVQTFNTFLGEFTLEYTYVGGSLMPQVTGFRRFE